MLETTTTSLEREKTVEQQMTVPETVPSKPLSTRNKKSSTAYKTISEVADELRLPQHVLRFWESKFKQVDPMKRGGGRRYYAPKDVDTLKKIHFLLYTKGYTIKGAKKLLSSRKNIAAELTGIEQKFDLFEPITSEPSDRQAQTQSPSGDMFGYTESDTIRTELKSILTELKALRGRLI